MRTSSGTSTTRASAHTVTADDGSFDSGKTTDGEFHHAFDKPGTYGYHCSVHPDMKGMVTVAASSARGLHPPDRPGPGGYRRAPCASW